VFIKTTKSKGRDYVKLVESYRDENKICRHKVLYNFGRLDLIRNNKSFLVAIKKLCELVNIEVYEDRADKYSQAQILDYGYLPYAILWETLGIGNCLRGVKKSASCCFSLSESAFLMVIQHLLSPKSKLATYENQEKYFGLSKIQLHQLYRTLDKLAKHKEKIEDALFYENYVKVDNKVDVVFYDVTTFAFESFIADELKNRGFSKDCKFNEVQVVMGLLIDSFGLPIGYELFSGNTFDGKTMVKALENIKKRFGIQRVIIVADRGLNSKSNLLYIKEAGYGYIVASKIKLLPKAQQDKIFDGSGFVAVSGDFKYKAIDYVNTFKDEDKKLHQLEEALIISYCSKRAKKDAADRQKLLEKAESLLEQPNVIAQSNKRGGKKFIKEINHAETKYCLNQELIEKDKRFDGFYGIQTSEKAMSAVDIMEAYHTLWKIEESFRIMKSTLEIRPIFHWTPERIRGHFLICFLAFMLERRLEFILRENNIEFSPERIRAALCGMQLVKLDVNDETVYIKTKMEELAVHICKLLNIKLPDNINTHHQLCDIFAKSVPQKHLWGQLFLF
jgi:transposase